jgi:uncharacterized protein YggU (UPF0235/DUF167 family)
VGEPGVRFSVRLTPHGGADRVDGVVDGLLRARVAAPAVDGAANRALLRLLADVLDVPQRDVRLVTGITARTKVVAVDGINTGRLLERWPGLRT